MITITINTDNAAFADGNYAAEIAYILRELINQLEEADRFQFAKVYDSNGNAVGRVTLTGKDRR